MPAALKIKGIFGAIVENTCIAAFHVLYIPLQLAAAVFSGVLKTRGWGLQRVLIKIFREG